MARAWSRNLFRVATTFDAPLGFVYRWCTDFGPEDASLTGEEFLRKVVRRSRTEIIFEDLNETPAGWMWLRNVVTLHPPDRWHLEATGNSLDAKADYRLTALFKGRTRFEMTWHLRPGLLGMAVPPKTTIEPALNHVWDTYRHALERDYSRARAASGKGRKQPEGTRGLRPKPEPLESRRLRIPTLGIVLAPVAPLHGPGHRAISSRCGPVVRMNRPVRPTTCA